MSLQSDQLVVLASMVGAGMVTQDVHVWSWVGVAGGGLLSASLMAGTWSQRLARWGVVGLAGLMFMPGIIEYLSINTPGVGMSLSAFCTFIVWAFLSLWTTDGAIAAKAVFDRLLSFIRGSKP